MKRCSKEVGRARTTTTQPKRVKQGMYGRHALVPEYRNCLCPERFPRPAERVARAPCSDSILTWPPVQRCRASCVSGPVRGQTGKQISKCTRVRPLISAWTHRETQVTAIASYTRPLVLKCCASCVSVTV